MAGDVGGVVQVRCPAAGRRRRSGRRSPTGRAAPRRTSGRRRSSSGSLRGSRSASARQSVRPFVCTPLLASRTIASPSRTSPVMRLRLRADLPDRRAGEDDRLRVDDPLQRRRLPAAPDGAGAPASFGESAGQVLARCWILEPGRIPDRRVHRDGDRQRAGRDQVVHDRRDGVDADVAVVSSCRSARASRRRRDSSCRGLLRRGRGTRRRVSIRYALSPRMPGGSVSPCAASAAVVVAAARWQARLNASSVS